MTSKIEIDYIEQGDSLKWLVKDLTKRKGWKNDNTRSIENF
jgi:hypothetical protein